MNTPLEYDLVGYLLGALDEAEREQIEAVLARDPQLRRRLQILDDHLLDMRADVDECEPPPGLADRTCLAVANASHSAKLPPTAAERGGGSRKWSMIDAVVAIGICLAIVSLFSPAIVESRQSAEVVACQNNLRELGTALQSYNDQHQDAFPAVPTDGNLAVAGTYAPLLFESGYVDDPGIFVCPSSSLARRTDPWSVPTLQEIRSAQGERLISLQQTAGGSYAYTLGHVVKGRYYPTRNLGRKSFVIMSDAPHKTSEGWQSANHGKQGYNVLFEDFHVEFVEGCCSDPGGDVFFENDAGFAAAGLTVNDAVVGSSATPPLRFIRLDR